MGLPVRTTFHYRVPKKYQGHLQVGMRVRVPLGHRQLQGYLVGFVEKPDRPSLKPILSILDEEPLLSQEMLNLARWIGRTYQAGWGEAIEATLPGPLRRGRTTMTSRLNEAGPPPPASTPLPLTAAQQKALSPILQTLRARAHTVYLLHGITGSGKTEVYLQAIDAVLNQGRSSIVLVPEIALTPQTIERFQGRFGVERVEVLHSRMPESRRLEAWHRIRAGRAPVVVGARSAVFAPVKELGLVVVDEEHEPSYKQEDVPRYHAREVSIERARLAKAPVILGSATPTLESYHRTQEGYHLLQLPERIEEVPLPEVRIVDMRREMETGRRLRIFSRALEEALEETLRNRQQAILFLNRRGFSTFVHCKKCGHVLKCPGCQVTLTYHVSQRMLICHYCRKTEKPPDLCPRCQGDYIRFRGTGTERVESELARLLPQAVIARLDTDATRERGAHEKILGAFSRHEADILVGTQMVAKGLDFPQVTLVGVISADTALNLPDFRSAERTFNLLTQVAGRAGRRQLPGKVVVQTYAPHHYAIQAASRHDYAGFFRQELAIRKSLRLPPFTRLIALTVRAAKESVAATFTEEAARFLRRRLPSQIQVVGPAPAPIPRLRRQFRYQILLKLETLEPVVEPITAALTQLHPPRGAYLAIDVDPL